MMLRSLKSLRVRHMACGDEHTVVLTEVRQHVPRGNLYYADTRTPCTHSDILYTLYKSVYYTVIYLNKFL